MGSVSTYFEITSDNVFQKPTFVPLHLEGSLEILAGSLPIPKGSPGQGAVEVGLEVAGIPIARVSSAECYGLVVVADGRRKIPLLGVGPAAVVQNPDPLLGIQLQLQQSGVVFYRFVRLSLAIPQESSVEQSRVLLGVQGQGLRVVGNGQLRAIGLPVQIPPLTVGQGSIGHPPVLVEAQSLVEIRQCRLLIPQSQMHPCPQSKSPDTTGLR